MQRGFAPILIVVALAALGIGVFVFNKVGRVDYRPLPQPTQKACTEDARLCPDGTSVGRTGPNCEFAACPALKESSSSAETANWKIHKSSNCPIQISYPSTWIIKDAESPKPYDNQNYNVGCINLTAPDYLTTIDSRGGFFIGISRTTKGTSDNSIIINSLDNYIKRQESVGQDTVKVKNKHIQTYGAFSGIQFEPQIGIEEDVLFIFTHDNYIYTIGWPKNYTGRYIDYLIQILSTFKFLP